ncbi:hypothetical protein AYO38_04385, partial [bacterium SCGC AG-212-C10]
IQGGKLTKVAMDGTKSTFVDCGGGPNGAAVAPDGSVYICNNGGQVASAGQQKAEAGRIQRVAPDGTLSTILTEVEGTALDAPNDCAFDSEGGFWFTNPNGFGNPGSVCYLSPSGEATRVASGIEFPNGIGISPDGRYLVICESMTGGLHSFEIEGPGKLGPRKTNGNIGRRSIPDGFCVDSQGRMIVAGFRTNNLFVLDMSDGKPLEIVEMPDTGNTNCCFGGPNFSTLFVTSSQKGEVLSIEWPVPGLVMPPPRVAK